MGFFGIFHYPFLYHNKKNIFLKLIITIKHFNLYFYYKKWDFFWDFCYHLLSSFKNFKNTKKAMVRTIFSIFLIFQTFYITKNRKTVFCSFFI